jgi:predicted ribosomally synthesized peptide with nif11-like leader
MSEEQLKAFLEKVKADTSLQEKLEAAADSEAVLAIAKEAGFTISTDELKSSQSVELLAKDLEIVAGGWSDSKCGGPTCGLGTDCTNGDGNHPWCCN